ncbi:histidine-rich glycoprotein isoform X1 [Strigops habroptila]|uniref:histidine-rich glycoprotein isoform X1 n=1 Tax=Strigops habroptila TaxID=2489341 RepID=UPI0011CF06EF|nr:histidine-rich glycoprotein isoform X1 [Strigops habroptila]
MLLLASAFFLMLLQCSNAQNEPSITPADCNTIETDAGVALDLVNRHRRSGYVFGLFRVADAHELHIGNSSFLYLTLDVLETECPVLSRRHWASCEYSDTYSMDFGQCKIIMHTSRLLGKPQLYGFNCTLSPVPPDLLECEDCPVKIEILEVTEEHKSIAAKALEKFNDEGNHTNYFGVDKVEKILKMIASHEGYILGFSIKETNCSKSARQADQTLECDFLDDWHTHVGFCKARIISGSDEPDGTDISCEIYHPWKHGYGKRCRYSAPGQPHRHPHHHFGHRHHHRHGYPPSSQSRPEDPEHNHSFKEEHQDSHEEPATPPPSGAPHHHPYPPHHCPPPPPHGGPHHPPPPYHDGPHPPPQEESQHSPSAPPPQEESQHSPSAPPPHDAPHPPPFGPRHGPHRPPHGPHHHHPPPPHGPHCPPPPHGPHNHHPPPPHGPHCPPPPHGPHHHHPPPPHGPHCPPPPHGPPHPPHFHDHHCNKTSISGKHIPFQITEALYRIPVLNQQDSLTPPIANFPYLFQSKPHSGEGIPFTGSSVKEMPEAPGFLDQLTQSKSCPGMPKLVLPKILPLFPHSSMAEKSA